jgi:hypothetical protein
MGQWDFANVAWTPNFAKEEWGVGNEFLGVGVELLDVENEFLGVGIEFLDVGIEFVGAEKL